MPVLISVVWKGLMSVVNQLQLKKSVKIFIYIWSDIKLLFIQKNHNWIVAEAIITFTDNNSITRRKNNALLRTFIIYEDLQSKDVYFSRKKHNPRIKNTRIYHGERRTYWQLMAV